MSSGVVVPHPFCLFTLFRNHSSSRVFVDEPVANSFGWMVAGLVRKS